MLDMTGGATGTGTGTGAGTGVGTGVGMDSGTGDGPAVGMAGMAWPGTGMGDAGMADAVRLAAGWGRGSRLVGGGRAAYAKPGIGFSPHSTAYYVEGHWLAWPGQVSAWKRLEGQALAGWLLAVAGA